MLWRFCWFSFASWTPIFLHKWRILLINLFGGKVDFSGFIYPDVRIWDPKNLIMGKKSCLGPGVECYNVAQIKIGNFATISQRVFLCSASHDYNQSIIKNNEMDLLIGPIFIEDFSWIAVKEPTFAPFSMIWGKSLTVEGILPRYAGLKSMIFQSKGFLLLRR